MMHRSLYTPNLIQFRLVRQAVIQNVLHGRQTRLLVFVDQGWKDAHQLLITGAGVVCILYAAYSFT